MQLWSLKDGVLTLDLHPGQAQAWRSDRRIIAILAGTQSGKTSFLPFWLWREIGRKGPGDYLAVTASYDLFKLKFLPEMREVFEHVLRCGRYWASDRIIELADPATGQFRANRADDPMWGRIILRSAESGGGLESSTAQAAILDEAGLDSYDLTTFEAVMRRLSLSLGRVLLGTTLYTLGWLKTQIYDRWRAGDPTIDVIQFDSTTNPAFPKEEMERARATMPRWRFNMQYRGQFERPAGLIYDAFNEADVIPPFALPDAWPRWLGLDFGGVHTAGVFLAEEAMAPEPRYYLYREYLAGGRTAEQHAAALLSGEPQIPTTIGGAKSEGQWRDEFRAGGLPVAEPPIRDVALGITRGYGLFAGRRVKVFDTCTGFLDQVRSYAYKLDSAGEPTAEIADKASYHYCLIGGTRITTNRGAIPIEQIQPGMQVLTRRGYRRVTAAWCTGIRPVRQVQLSNGQTLTGTLDHPVWVQGQGFTPLGELCYNSTVQHQEETLWLVRFASLTASAITAIRNRRVPQTASTSSDKAATYIGTCGYITTGQFRRVIKSIIRTAIRVTTLLTTWRWFWLPITFLPTISPTSHRSAASISSSTWPLWRASGTDPQKGTSGTGNIWLSNGSDISRWINSVNIAVRFSPLGGSAERIGSAPMPVDPPPAGPVAWIASPAYVRFVARHLRTNATLSGPIAPTHVQCAHDVGSRRVYNLTVEDAHEYYANGILVSNCDAFRYVGSVLADPPAPHAAVLGPARLVRYAGRR